MRDAKFIDEVALYLKAGRGGEGCSARRMYRGHFVNIGGDGGEGGNIFIEADPNIFDLSKFRNRSTLSAQDGHFGLAHKKKGRNGQDLVLKVPVGTLIKDADDRVLFDLEDNNQKALAVQGGRGGKGNFKRKTTLAPQDGQEREINLDFRIPADVVLLGYTNVGKSTLLSKITHLKAPISEFPFTTKSPLWGVVQKDYRAFTILELPAIIGKKNQDPPGLKFLKHITRPRVVVFLLDPENPRVQRQALQDILAQNGIDLSHKYTLRVLNKTDKIKTKVPTDHLAISAREQKGLDDFIRKVFSLLKI